MNNTVLKSIDPTRPMILRGGVLFGLMATMIMVPTPMKADLWDVMVSGERHDGQFTYNNVTKTDSGWTGAGTGFVDDPPMEFTEIISGVTWEFQAYGPLISA